MNYKQTIDFLYSQLPAYHRIGKAAYKNDLHNSLALDDYFGKPHSGYKSVHIAGTNGKGSVSHMIASVLMEAGYRTGLYTSPHLKDFRERIKVNGKLIPERAVTQFIKRHAPVFMSLKPSFFEMTVAMAFEYFAKAGVDIAVIETGLGGRLDSTNIITPVVTVITNIGHDHMDLLGDTLEKIAWEKAGIIKTRIPVVISETHNDSKNVFIKKASESGSDIYFADHNFSVSLNEYDYLTASREYSVRDQISGMSFMGKTELAGDYQSKNIQAVFQTFRALTGTIDCSYNEIINGIAKVVANTGLKGRWQVIGRNPLIICDTGHNKEGLEYVLNQLERIPSKQLRMILGFVSDKDLGSILPLFPSSAVYYFTKASVPRALDERTLLEKAEIFGLRGKSYPDVKSAVAAASKDASEHDTIFIGGSTFVVADAL